jgi:hypothetical protein
MPVNSWKGRTRALVFAIAVSTLAACGDLYSRTDFTTMVMNKSDTEVTKTVGKPASIDASNPRRVIWTYNNSTFDIDNQNKRDSRTRLIMEPTGNGGKLMVTSVEFG